MDDGGVWWVLLVGGLATYATRALGVVLSNRLDPDGAMFDWISAIAYALLAALVARMILLPVGVLEATGLAERIAALAAGVMVYFRTHRNVLAAVVAGLVTLAGLSALVGPEAM